MFKTDTHLAHHLQDETACEKIKPLSEDEVLFINKDQKEMLRPRSQRGLDEEERWIRVFQVVFPDVSEDQLPSPCKFKF